jgi:integrase
MGTLGRPSALLELTPVERDRKNGLIALNPEGRRQNKKFRPTVLEPKTLAALLNEWEGADTQAMRPHERYCLYTSKDSVDSAISRACAADKANLPMLSSYSFRHRGTTVLRNAKVPKEQIDFQLGHVQEGARSTQGYGQYEPDYLADSARALNDWICRVLKLVAEQLEADIIQAA